MGVARPRSPVARRLSLFAGRGSPVAGQQSPVSHRAFTLVELIIVMVIMAILAGMVVAGVKALGLGSDQRKTETILETIRQALELTKIKEGSGPSPVEHPLAGSYGAADAPRLLFCRADGDLLDSATATETTALYGVLTENLVAEDRDRLLLADDIYADPRVPLLYGVPREAIGILGGAIEGVTEKRRLPSQPDTDPPTEVADPDDATLYPHIEDGAGKDPEDSKQTVNYVLNHGTAKSTLNQLGALEEPDESEGALVAYGRVWSRVGDDYQAGSTRWQPGHLSDPEHPEFEGGEHDDETRWIPYRLRGLAVYDAWGNEVLYAETSSGGTLLMSCGPDGCFRFDPGPDGVYDTPAHAVAAIGDDLDARNDNVQNAVGGDL